MTPAITVRGLSHYYGERCALRDIDLEVRPGEILGVPTQATNIYAVRPPGGGTSAITAIADELSVANGALSAGSIRLVPEAPALGTWGAVALVGLVAGLGGRILRRRAVPTYLSRARAERKPPTRSI